MVRSSDSCGGAGCSCVRRRGACGAVGPDVDRNGAAHRPERGCQHSSRSSTTRNSSVGSAHSSPFTSSPIMSCCDVPYSSSWACCSRSRPSCPLDERRSSASRPDLESASQWTSSRGRAGLRGRLVRWLPSAIGVVAIGIAFLPAFATLYQLTVDRYVVPVIGQPGSIGGLGTSDTGRQTPRASRSTSGPSRLHATISRLERASAGTAAGSAASSTAISMSNTVERDPWPEPPEPPIRSRTRSGHRFLVRRALSGWPRTSPF